MAKGMKKAMLRRGILRGMTFNYTCGVRRQEGGAGAVAALLASWLQGRDTRRAGVRRPAANDYGASRRPCRTSVDERLLTAGPQVLNWPNPQNGQACEHGGRCFPAFLAEAFAIRRSMSLSREKSFFLEDID